MQSTSSGASIAPLAAEAPRLPSLRAKLARGSLLALVGYGGSQLLRLGGNLVLWRLLYAEAFGLMAIVNVFMQGLAMFSDVGIGPSIIQNERGDDPDYLDTAWTIQTLRGLALFAVAAVAAVPVAHFYRQEELASLIPAVGAGAILAGFNSTKLFTVTRHIALGRLTMIDLAAQAVGLLVMVAWALVSRSIWALVIGGIVNNGVRLALGHALLPGGRNHFRWHGPSRTTLMHFGRWIFLSTLLTFAAMQSDRLIFGKLTTMSMLGVYSIATIWATFPSQILGHVLQSVMFPTLCRLHNDGVDIAESYREVRAPWLLAAGWLSACLVSGGPVLIRFLYDDRARDAGWITQILSIGAWFLALEMTNGSALLAQGKAKWVAWGSLAKLSGMVLLIPLGMMLWGFKGAVLGFTAAELFRYAVSLVGASTSALRGYRQDLILTAFIAATVVLGFVARLVEEGVVSGSALAHTRAGACIEGVTIFVTVSAAWGVLLWLHQKQGRPESALGRTSA